MTDLNFHMFRRNVQYVDCHVFLVFITPGDPIVSLVVLFDD